ncbi:glycosyltransferase family 2 protein [Angustibacter luteus]|uniref:Glycosyltransferase family 2 protein n=1 Tax=Angustibacter luteus TaxID=658456 RepID=A0ABW1JGZ1_9ACTN
MHDGAPWLPRVLAALDEQTRPPDLVVAVDTGSTDGSPALLGAAFDDAQVVTAARDTGFGDAVGRALEHAQQRGDLDGVGWIWLLHDDSAAQPRALEQLLAAAGTSASVGVVGAKLVDWDDANRLVEVGLTVGRGGRRDTGVDGIERDQGQHDHRGDVLAVPSAGMLVRRDVWDELEGFDPALKLMRDDIDLCWRAQLAGHRVLLAPNAVVADAQAATNGLREVHAEAGALRRVDLRHGQHVALARCSWWAVPFLLCWLVLLSAGRAIALLAAKSPRRAFDEVLATGVVLIAPWRWLGSRWRSRGRRRVPGHSLSSLLTPRSAPLRRAGDVVSAWAATEPPVSTHAGPDAGLHTVIDEVADPADLAPLTWPSRVVRHPLTWVVLALVAATAVAWRRLGDALLGSATLTGGELRPSPAGAVQHWHAGLDAVRGPGLGTEQLGSPAAVLDAGWIRLVETVAGAAAPARSLTLLLAAAPVLAAIAAYVAAGIATRSRWLRAWAALAWGAAPLLTAAVTQGRVGPVAITIVLPLVAAALARALSPDKPGRLTATFAAALGIAVVGSAVPLLGAVGVGIGLLGVLLARGARWRALLVAVLPVALLGPWVTEIVADPRLLLAGPGAVADPAPVSQVGDGLNIWQAWTDVLRLHQGWPLWTVALWLGPLTVLATLSLLRGGRRGWAVAALGWLAVLGLALAVLAPWVQVSRPGQQVLTGWSGTGALLALLALLAAPLVAADGLQSRLARYGFGWRQLLLGPVVLVAVLAPVVAVGAWAWEGADGPLQTTRGTGLPAVAADAAYGPLAVRTLVLAAEDGQITYRLDGGEPGAVARDVRARAGADERATADPVRPVAAALANPDTALPGPGTVASLRQLAVGFLLVRDPAPAQLTERLDATAGLARIGRSTDGQLYRVGSGGLDSTARAQLVSAAGASLAAVPTSGPHAAVDTTIPAGRAGRLLVLSEAPSDLRHAELNGIPLRVAGASAVTGWRQAYVLPTHGGHLVVRADDQTVTRWRWAELALVLLVGLLALPVRRPNGELR